MRGVARTLLSRTARRRWRPRQLVTGREPVALGPLVSPWRYDIVVRARFFDFLSRHEQKWSDPAEIVQLAYGEPYRTWFVQVAMTRFKPWVLSDPQRLEAAFEDRVLRSITLLSSFLGKGFDPAYPVILRMAAPGVGAGGDGEPSRRYYAGDGCHRLGLLLSSGAQAVAPELYRVDAEPLHKIIDNTRILRRHLDLDEEQWAQFLSLGYADRAFRTTDELVADVRAHNPHRLGELLRVITMDARATGPISPQRVGGEGST